MSFILKIGSQEFKNFNNFKLNLKYDSIASTFSTDVYFNPENKEHLKLFKPFTYQECTIEFNNKLIFTGTILVNTFNDSSTTQFASIGGYSKCGIIEDCDIPTSAYPLQSDGRTIAQICERLLNIYGIKYVIDSSVSNRMNRVLVKSVANERQTVKSYLSEITNQVNVIMTHDEYGRIIFTQPNTKKTPIISIDSDVIAQPTTKISLSCNGQSMHRNITVLKQANSDGGNAGQSTLINPYCPINRTKVLTQSSGDDNTTQEASRNALSEQLKSIQLTMDVSNWIDMFENLIIPNNIIEVKSSRLFLFKKVSFFLESVAFSGDSTSQTSVLTCVLPSVYDNSTVINIFE